MDLVVKGLVLAAFIVSIAYIFTRIALQHGMTKAFIAVMILVDIYAVILMILGIDRPIFIVTTRLGNATVTALELFLLVKIPLTVYIIIKSEQLQQVLG